MRSSLPRALCLLSVAGAAAVLLMVAVSASSAGALAGSHADPALLRQCTKAVLGVTDGSATPVTTSADPQVVNQLAIFRKPRSTADDLPAATQLRRTLAAAGARTYDPGASVAFAPAGAPGGVFAVPATLAAHRLPGGCTTLTGFAAIGALQAQTTGSGQGVCLISFESESTGPSIPTLPGKTRPQPAKTITDANAECESDAVLSGYDGALGKLLPGASHSLAVIPDGVSAITYMLTDGRQVTTPVIENLAVVPTVGVSIPVLPRRATAAEIGRRFTASLPTEVTETGPDAAPIQTLPRPPSLIPDFVKQIVLLRRLISPSSVFGSSSSGSTVSCSARTHRCIAVTVSTKCDTMPRCQTTRTISRYRYVGAHPPFGTTDIQNLPTAPIRGRASRVIRPPGKLTLVLSGSAHRAVDVLLSVTCFAHGLVSSGGPPALRVAVPSRTPISGVPSRSSRFYACDAGALALSPQAGRIGVKVVRG